MCAPFVEDLLSQDALYGAAVTSAPNAAPSSRNCTPTTPTLSLAVADTVTAPATVAPFAGAVMETTGGVVSLETVTPMTALVVRFPAASRATADRVCAPFVEDLLSHDALYGAIVTSAPNAAPSSSNCTPTTPTLSLAPANTLTVPETVAPLAGAVIETAGGVVSLKTVTLTTALVVRFPAASRATAERVWAALVAAALFHEQHKAKP